MKDFVLPAADGFPLAASAWGPPGARAGVLVVPATGVKRSLYRAFAAHLAERGFGVLTWDWRGTGGSRPASLRGFAATMRQWGEVDFAGGIRWARREWGDRPLVAVGHSFGGQALGLAPNRGELAAAVTVAAQSGYWGHWPWPRRYRYALVWHVAMPSLVGLCGYLPARTLGLGEDLPAGVARDWARWCRNPDYLGDWSGHRDFRAPLLVLSFDDDAFAPPRAVAALHAEFGSRERTLRRVAPREIGRRVIGHFGFFRPGAPSLWVEVGDWIGRQADRAAAAGPPVATEAAETGPR